MMRLVFIFAAAMLAIAIACGSDPTARPEPTIMPGPTATEVPASQPQSQQSAPAAEPTAAPAMLVPCEGSRGGSVGDCAPEFAGTQEWINSEPLSMEGLLGNVVLIDFWTYTCVNCIRTLPFLQEWHQRYADDGLVIVGVHTPEFEFEKVYDNVVQATVDEGVAWPVVQDNDFTVWRSYSNRYWPAKYLIDRNGEIQYRHFGEGKYAETEEWIRQLLEQDGMASIDPNLSLPQDQQRDDAFRLGMDVTRELFAGWKFTAQQGRGGIAQANEYLEAARSSFNGEGYPSVVAQFEAPGKLEPNLIYFHGPWAIGPESARHAEMTMHHDNYLSLVYSARSVNAVLTSDSGEPYDVRITVNGEYLTDENKGDDIIIGDGGVSYLRVTEPKLYKLVEHDDWQGEQELRMSSMSDDFGLYSFTFGVYEDGY